MRVGEGMQVVGLGEEEMHCLTILGVRCSQIGYSILSRLEVCTSHTKHQNGCKRGRKQQEKASQQSNTCQIRNRQLQKCKGVILVFCYQKFWSTIYILPLLTCAGLVFCWFWAWKLQWDLGYEVKGMICIDFSWDGLEHVCLHHTVPEQGKV